MRSAEKTTAAALPALRTPGTAARGRLRSGPVPSFQLPPPPPSASLLLLSLPAPASRLPTLLFINTDQAPCCQQKHTRPWCCRPTPAVNTLPRAVCHCQSRTCSVTRSPQLLPAQLLPTAWDRALLRPRHTCSPRGSLSVCVNSWQRLTFGGPGRHMLCPQTWAVNFVSCCGVTLGN